MRKTIWFAIICIFIGVGLACMLSYQQWLDAAIICIFIGVGLACMLSYQQWLDASDYWGSAPDGDYTVFISMNEHIDYKNHRVFFPLCESSGGDLHGWWTFTDNTHFYPYPENGSYYGVRVENNRIIIAWSK